MRLLGVIGLNTNCGRPWQQHAPWLRSCRSRLLNPLAEANEIAERGNHAGLERPQPRSSLSIARLKIAKSRVLPSSWSLVRIDQTCFGRSGGFAPISLPLFQGVHLAAVETNLSCSCMVMLLSY